MALSNELIELHIAAGILPTPGLVLHQYGLSGYSCR